MKFAAFLMLASSLGRVPVCWAQDITIRLLDVRNARPLANETVNVQFHVAREDDIRMLKAKTGPDGTTTLRLPEPMPQAIFVLAGYPDLYPCSALSTIDTHQVISEGLVSRCCKPVQQCRCKFGKQILQLHARPGELILLARPMTWFERFTNKFDLWG